MRSKEDAPDYRYFPDPDLVEFEIDQDFVEEIQQGMPELPDQKVNRIIKDYRISKKDALILTKDRNVSVGNLILKRIAAGWGLSWII